MKSTDERIEYFKQTLEPYRIQYGNDLIESFINYWTEKTRSGKQFKAEKETTWEVSKRLATFLRNHKTWNKSNGQTSKKYEQLNDLERLAKTILGRGEEGSLFN